MVLDLPNAPGLPDVFIISVKLLEHKTAISLGLFNISTVYTRGHGVAQLVEALCYRLEVRGFDSRWCHWNFLLT